MPPPWEWRIYYGDESRVTGTTEAEWDAAPSDNVQIVVEMSPAIHHKWWGVFEDRQLWTGDDNYSLNGWSSKQGAQILREVYDRIWERALADP